MPGAVIGAGAEDLFRRHARDVVPHYSTRTEDAWLVVEELDRLGWSVVAHNDRPRRGWRARCRKDPSDDVVEGAAGDVALAICRMALRAVEMYG